MSPARSAAGPLALATLLLAACAGPAAKPAPAPAMAVEAPPAVVPAATAIPAAQRAAAVAALDRDLKDRLSRLPPSEALRRLAGDGGQPSRLRLEADRAFEVGSGQLKPALLLPLAEAATASQAGGAWVLHVIGYAPTAAEADLAERRAAAVGAYLVGRGVPAGRLRTETRSGAARVVDLQFAPVVTGAEAQAWMPPSAVAGR